MTHLTPRHNISIALIILYTPTLLLSIHLTIRHGLSRSSGWRFLLTFSLARLLAASFDLATIANPSNISLYIGEWVLLGIALSPLELVSLGFISRVLASINKSKQTLLTPRHVQLVQLANTVGLALAIAGGVRAGNDVDANGGRIVVSSLTEAAVGLFIASFAAIVVGAALTWRDVRCAEDGEKRLLGAVAATAPFLLVRVVYTALSVFGGGMRFNPVQGDVWYLLGMALIMELVIVYVFLGVGMTLKKIEKGEGEVEMQAKNASAA
ncbi:putative transmembrane protein [Diplodia seriata]|uniref:Putative transmembrane protein n=1 Tax=Diplodia seriata TaxID=420778 RepID=A0A0G2E209_9PEZI|nr:putative transmembrane protein [Diplodia seriata]